MNEEQKTEAVKHVLSLIAAAANHAKHDSAGAMHLSQAALNAANALGVIANTDKSCT